MYTTGKSSTFKQMLDFNQPQLIISKNYTCSFKRDG